MVSIHWVGVQTWLRSSHAGKKWLGIFWEEKHWPPLRRTHGCSLTERNKTYKKIMNQMYSICYLWNYCSVQSYVVYHSNPITVIITVTHCCTKMHKIFLVLLSYCKNPQNNNSLSYSHPQFKKILTLFPPARIWDNSPCRATSQNLALKYISKDWRGSKVCS